MVALHREVPLSCPRYQMALFLGIDSGTQSTKAVVLDAVSGRVLAEAREAYEMIPGLPPGHMEQHPNDWIKALESVVQRVLSEVDRSQIRGIGVSGQQHGFVPLDGEGRVIRPAKLWCDTSTVRECAIITKRLGGPAAALRETGSLVLPGFTAPKILWLKRNEPAAYRRLRHILLPHDYLNHYLTGSYSMEYGDGSGTALMDVRKRTWSVKAIAAVDTRIRDFLPDLKSSTESAGTLRPLLARGWGLTGEITVSTGGGDNMMAAIGTGNIKPGVVTASLGTSGTIFAFSKKPVTDPRGEIAGFCSSTGGWLPLVCTMNVTSVTERIRSLFGYEHRAMDRAVKSVPAGADGLTLLPYFLGERTPNIPDGSGAFLGLTPLTADAPHLARATLEGVTFGLNYGLGRLRSLGIRPKEIRLTGGGAKSPVWRQLCADIFGVPVVAMKEDEGAALGAALQAAASIAGTSGKKTPLESLVHRAVKPDESSRCIPAENTRRMYRKLQARFDNLSLSLREAFALVRD